MNGHKNQAVDPYSQRYWLQNLHQGARGRNPGFSKGLGPVLETFPWSLLQALQEGDNQGCGGSPRPTLK